MIDTSKLTRAELDLAIKAVEAAKDDEIDDELIIEDSEGVQ